MTSQSNVSNGNTYVFRFLFFPISSISRWGWGFCFGRDKHEDDALWCSSKSHHISLALFLWNYMLFPIKCSSLVSSSWLVSRASSLSRHWNVGWTRIWILPQNENRLEGIMGSITFGKVAWHPNATKNHIWCSQASLSSSRMGLLPPHGKETKIPSPQGLSQIWMWTIITPTQNYYLLIIGQLSQPL